MILDSIRRWNTQNVRIYPIAVGSDLKLALLNSIARNTGGFLTQVEANDSIKMIVIDHLMRISRPNLTNLELSYGSLKTIDVFPTILPNVPVGGRVQQHGRYVSGGLFPVTLTGNLLNNSFSLTKDVLFGDTEINNRAIARLWARAKINALLDEIQRNGELKELVNAVIDLSIRYNILTKYTALYADPDDPRPTGVPEDERPVEIASVLISPNPSTQHAQITIRLANAHAQELVTVMVYDQLGRVIATLFHGFNNGQIDLDWNLTNDAGERVPMGVYHVVVKASDRSTVARLIVQ